MRKKTHELTQIQTGMLPLKYNVQFGFGGSLAMQGFASILVALLEAPRAS